MNTSISSSVDFSFREESSLDSGIGMSFCEHEEPLSKAEEIYLNNYFSKGFVNGEKDSFGFNTSLNFAPVRFSTRNSLRIEDYGLSEEHLEQREKRYLKMINDCLNYKIEEVDSSCIDEGIIDWSDEDESIDLLDNSNSKSQFCDDTSSRNVDTSGLKNRAAHEKHSNSLSKQPCFEYDPLQPPVLNSRSKISHFMSKLGSAVLTVVNPLGKIALGIPFAKEVERESSPQRQIPVSPVCLEDELENITEVSMLSRYSLEMSSMSCFERIMQERKKRNEKKRKQNLDRLNELEKCLKNLNSNSTEVTNLKLLVSQLDSVQNQNLSLAKEIDRIKNG